MSCIRCGLSSSNCLCLIDEIELVKARQRIAELERERDELESKVGELEVERCELSMALQDKDRPSIKHSQIIEYERKLAVLERERDTLTEALRNLTQRCENERLQFNEISHARKLLILVEASTKLVAKAGVE